MVEMSPLAKKLLVILPLLGSDNDGEALGAARAIDRILKSGGSDWHKFTSVFEAGVIALADGRSGAGASQQQQSQSSGRRYARPPTYASISRGECMDWFDAIAAQGSRWLTEWEIDFTASIASKLGDVGRELSEKQVACIDKLLYRAFMRGVRP